MRLLGGYLSPDKEYNDRADDRHDETGGVKSRTWLRFGEQSADQSTDNRSTDPKQRCHYESEVLGPGHNGACN